MTREALPLDHLGLATPDLGATSTLLEELLGAVPEGEAIEDPLQRARVRFLALPAGPRIELLEPTAGGSPVFRMARAGGGLHHVALQVAALDGFEAWCRGVGAQPVARPAPAPAIGPGRRVAFAFAQALGLVEFVETPGAPPLADARWPADWRATAGAAMARIARLG